MPNKTQYPIKIPFGLGIKNVLWTRICDTEMSLLNLATCVNRPSQQDCTMTRMSKIPTVAETGKYYTVI